LDIPNPSYEPLSDGWSAVVQRDMEAAATAVSAGRADDARELYAGIIQHECRHSPAYLQLGLLEFSENKILEGFIKVAAACKHAPFDTEPHFRFALMLQGVGIHGAARLHFEQVLKLDPDRLDARDALRAMENEALSEEQRETYIISISDAAPPRPAPDAALAKRVKHEDKLKLSDGRYDIEPEFAHLENA
jgi:tetratricopeptide (TPR) repeat protein